MFGLKSLKRVTSQLTTPRVTVEQIHSEFDQAGEKAVQQAKFLLERLNMDAIQSQVDSLKSLGFTNSSVVASYNEKKKMADREKQRLSIAEKYSQRYPGYKFIFIDQVSDICSKYGLVCGVVSRFKGSVPQKNLKEIAEFKPLKEDIYYELENFSNRIKFDPSNNHFYNEKDVEVAKAEIYSSRLATSHLHNPTRPGYYDAPSRTFSKVPLFICAPFAEMVLNINERVSETGFIIDDDPIVLHFVKDGFLIISKWGPEAKDPSLVNEKMN